jgi:hypothetical protein
MVFLTGSLNHARSILECPATRKERKGKIEIPSGRDFSAEKKLGEVFSFCLKPIQVINLRKDKITIRDKKQFPRSLLCNL